MSSTPDSLRYETNEQSVKSRNKVVKNWYKPVMEMDLDLDPDLAATTKIAEAAAASSTKFTQEILLNRGNELRTRPWFRSLPVRPVLLTMYRSLVLSQSMVPFHLTSLGNTLLPFLNNLSGGGPHKKDFELDKYLEILEMIFLRLKKGSEEDGDENVKIFLDTVWGLHTNGSLDLSKTRIPGIMVESSPSTLDTVLISCIEGGDPSALILLSASSPENFCNIMQFLRIKYVHASSSEQKSLLFEFGCQFQRQLKEKCSGSGGGRYVSCFPTRFHPLIHLLDNISASPWTKSLLKNEVVLAEMGAQLDRLCYQCELAKFEYSDLIFILATIPNLPTELIFKDKISDMGLWMRRALKRSELPYLPIRSF